MKSKMNKQNATSLFMKQPIKLLREPTNQSLPGKHCIIMINYESRGYYSFIVANTEKALSHVTARFTTASIWSHMLTRERCSLTS